MSSPAPARLQAQGLGKTLGGKPVLAEVELALGPGDRLLVTGGNGAGKSTLLRLCAGLLSPDAGRLEVRGAPPRLGDPEVAYLPPGDRGLYWRLSVVENLRFRGASRCRGETLEASVQRALGALALEAHADTPVRHLSTGWKRRAALAGCLVGEPSLLLLDEPFASLDPAAVGVAEAALEAHRSGRGATLLLTSPAPLPGEGNRATLELPGGAP